MANLSAFSKRYKGTVSRYFEPPVVRQTLPLGPLIYALKRFRIYVDMYSRRYSTTQIDSVLCCIARLIAQHCAE
jgi:hypothetical protein